MKWPPLRIVRFLTWFMYFCKVQSVKNNERGRKLTLNITPQTHIRTTQGDRIFFRIPRSKLRPEGLKRLLRIERYNQYKIDLLTESKRKDFFIPAAGLSITFYIPCPESWSAKKKKAHHGLLHQSRPDLDNLTKALFDSLVTEDKHIASLSATKRWVDFPDGWIECVISPLAETAQMQELVAPPSKNAPL
jgi:Holliday junction resolvase RusA-like endonuclease